MAASPQYSEKDIDSFLRNCGRGQMPNVQKLVAKGMPINIVNSAGFTPLMSAARNFRAEVVEFLLKQGADVHARSETKETPLHMALGSSPEMTDWAKDGSAATNEELQCAITRMILDAGGEVTAKSYIGMTPLMNAAWYGCGEAAKLILAKPQDIAATNDDGETARDIAIARDHSDIVAAIDASGG